MYTRHGHHISGTSTANSPSKRARCGGPGFCRMCNEDVMRAGFVGQSTVNPVLAYFSTDGFAGKQYEVASHFLDLAAYLERKFPDSPERAGILASLLWTRNYAISAVNDIHPTNP